MLCRILTRRDDNRLIVRLAGRLSEAQVPDLLAACGSPDALTVLELDDLVSADAVGMDALLRIERHGAQLVGVPKYIRLKLDLMARQSDS